MSRLRNPGTDLVEGSVERTAHLPLWNNLMESERAPLARCCTAHRAPQQSCVDGNRPITRGKPDLIRVTCGVHDRSSTNLFIACLCEDMQAMLRRPLPEDRIRSAYGDGFTSNENKMSRTAGSAAGHKWKVELPARS
jgi:hypothetical protein